jgi:hypothetical protein
MKKRLENEGKTCDGSTREWKLDEGGDCSFGGPCPRQSSYGLLDEDDDRDANDRFCRLVVRNW